jgi:hypothetical protein
MMFTSSVAAACISLAVSYTVKRPHLLSDCPEKKLGEPSSHSRVSLPPLPQLLFYYTPLRL